MFAHLKQHLLSYVVIPLLILTIAASYYRFMVSYDYLVRYEGECDPYTSSCYLYCEDEACTEPFYYTLMTRSAALIQAECGDDILSCDFAYACGENEPDCTVGYCDPLTEVQECEFLEADDDVGVTNNETFKVLEL